MLSSRHWIWGGTGQYSEAAWCAVELEKASGTQADTEAAALLETAAQRRAALTQVDVGSARDELQHGIVKRETNVERAHGCLLTALSVVINPWRQGRELCPLACRRAGIICS